MKFNFRKIASTAASTLMVGSTVALAAAASYPAPFAQGGTADVGIVYGSAPGTSSSDLVAATNIQIDLEQALRDQGAGGSGTPTGGDFVLLDKSNDHLNIGNSLSGVFGNTVDDEDLEVLLADGEYTADDSDDFSYEQSITLGSPVLSHFRDSDYEDQVGLESRTPVLGVNISDGDFVFNYTINFLDQAESDVSGTDMEDFEGSDLPLFGKTFYVSDAKNGSTTSIFGKWTLLDSANTAIVSEGETVTVNVGSESYQVSISFVDSTEAILVVNGETTTTMNEGETYKLDDGAYVAVRDILTQDYQGGIKKVDFSIGSGKLEITSGSDVKINEEAISDLKAWVYKGSSNGDAQTIDKIEIEWKADDDMFITPESEIELPGFGGLKFTMGDLVRNTEEKTSLENDGDDSIIIRAPIKDGVTDVNLVYANSTGDIVGIGKSATERLLTAAPTAATATYKKKLNNADYHDKVVFSYNSTDDAQSYVLSFSTNEDTSAGRNEATVKNELTGETWTDRKTGDSFDLGDVQFTISTIVDNSTDEWVELNWTIASGMSIDRLYTDGGLMIQLPYSSANETTTSNGAIWLGSGTTNHTDGHNYNQFYVFMQGEDKDDNLVSGTAFNFTINDNSDNELEVSEMDNSGTGGPRGLELQDSNTYETYVKDDVAPRILHYTDGDQDFAEVYYPEGDSETYAEVFLAETGTSSGSGGVDLGNIVVFDSEVSSVSANNLVVVGGSCINTVASTLLGGAGCGSSFESETGVGAGEFLIQSFNSPYDSSKIATLVAGYNAADTTNAAAYLTNADNDVDTTVGMKYVGTDADTAQLI